MIEPILEWQQKARPNPSQTDKEISLGIHLEEVAEMLDNLQAENQNDAVLISDIAGDVKRLASYLKKGVVVATPKDRVEHLDSLCDQVVTAIGEAYLQGFDIIGALDEVNNSNWSKFENGEPVFDDNGKVKKGKNYFKPDLSKFV